MATNSLSGNTSGIRIDPAATERALLATSFSGDSIVDLSGNAVSAFPPPLNRW